jgi:hypothetical protein
LDAADAHAARQELLVRGEKPLIPLEARGRFGAESD